MDCLPMDITPSSCPTDSPFHLYAAMSLHSHPPWCTDQTSINFFHQDLWNGPLPQQQKNIIFRTYCLWAWPYTSRNQTAWWDGLWSSLFFTMQCGALPQHTILSMHAVDLPSGNPNIRLTKSLHSADCYKQQQWFSKLRNQEQPSTQSKGIVVIPHRCIIRVEVVWVTETLSSMMT